MQHLNKEYRAIENEVEEYLLKTKRFYEKMELENGNR